MARASTRFRMSWPKAYDVRPSSWLLPIDLNTIAIGIHASKGHIVSMFFNVVNLHPFGAHAGVCGGCGAVGIDSKFGCNRQQAPNRPGITCAGSTPSTSLSSLL
jgi:hypothetical protein